METIPFYKMSGSGNDFIIIDNRIPIVDDADLKNLITGACRRKMSLCGNGARCVSRFAFLKGIAGEKLSFETDVGIVSATITGERVKIKMTEPTDIREEASLDLADRAVSYRYINTGVPHVVIETENLEGVDVVDMGREIRRHPLFSPGGTNVNFVRFNDNGTLDIRTYERGVEDETLACGTGAVAAALAAFMKHGLQPPVTLRTRSGEHLRIYFKDAGTGFWNVFLEGDARVIYKGELNSEAWR